MGHENNYVRWSRGGLTAMVHVLQDQLMHGALGSRVSDDQISL